MTLVTFLTNSMSYKLVKDSYALYLTRVAKTCQPVGAIFLAGANFGEKHAKNRRKQAKSRRFLVLIFWGGKLVGANFYAFCNYGLSYRRDPFEIL